MVFLTGCGMSEEEAKAYVEASLDASYMGEFDAFVEITDSTPEGAAAMYDENIEHIMEAAGFSDQNLDEELTKNYKQLFLDLIKRVDYTVGEAVKGENDSFTIDVTVKPMTILNGIEEELIQVLLDRIEGLDELPDEDEIRVMGFEEMYKILSEKVDSPKYSEETIVVTINLHKNDEGMYAISEEDMLALDNALFAVEEIDTEAEQIKTTCNLKIDMI